MTDTFSKFGDVFQERLTNILLTDRMFSDQMYDVLELSYFESVELRELCEILYSLKAQYKVHPTVETIFTTIKTKDIPEDLKIRCAKFLQKAKPLGEVPDAQFVKDESLKFCKHQHLKRTLLDSFTLVKEEDIRAYDKITTMIRESLQAGEPPEEGHDLVVDFEARFVPDNRQVIPTPWDRLNELLKGGTGRGEMNVVMAPTGGGKSFWLVAVGAHAARLGYNVHHYTLELKKEVVGNRYDAFLTGVHLDDLLEHKEEIRGVYEREFRGNVKIKESYMRGLSTNGIRSNLERAKQAGSPVDMLVVDYADIMKPSDGTLDNRISLGVIFDELRALGQEYNCSVWTATQTNRSGLEAEVVTLDSISESYRKAHGSDLILTVSRTRDDKVKGVGRVFIAKNRNGSDGMVLGCRIELGRAHFEFLSEDDERLLLSGEDDLQESVLEALKRKKKERGAFG